MFFHTILLSLPPQTIPIMQKTYIVSVAIIALAVVGQAQTVRQTDRWGEALFFIEGNTIKRKDRWGDKLYYFDFEPTRWQIVCVVLSS